MNMSPTTVIINWRCNFARNDPFEVNIKIRVEGMMEWNFFFRKNVLISNILIQAQAIG